MPLTVFQFILISQSCGPSDKAARDARIWCLKKVDTLKAELTAVRKNFKYSMDEVALRKEHMEEELKVLTRIDGKNLSSEEKSEIVQYSSVLGVYKPIAGEYKNVVLETEDIFYRIKALDKSVRDGIYDSGTDEFKKVYSEIHRDLDKELHESAELSEKLVSVEPMFQRLSPKIESLIAKFNPEFEED